VPIQNYSGETFVAFMDICGFKELMRTGDKAWRALDKMYATGYRVLMENNNQSPIEGLFISDSGILFVRRNDQDVAIELDLHPLLSVVKKINRMMLNDDLMLTTSIAYGQFRYQERIEFVGIEKNPIYGNAYSSAYFDNANGSPRIQPGQCRLVKIGLPPICNEENLNTGQYRSLIRERTGDMQHYYFYWNVEVPFEIEGFEERYKDAYNLKFQGMLKALKGH
jgi:hypothetical protein